MTLTEQISTQLDAVRQTGDPFPCILVRHGGQQFTVLEHMHGLNVQKQGGSIEFVPSREAASQYMQAALA